MNRTHDNANAEGALKYHEETKHREEKLWAEPHRLDWKNQPLPFKIYRGLESVPLKLDLEAIDRSTPPAVEALLQSPGRSLDEKPDEQIPDLDTLSTLLFLSAGITKRVRRPGGEIFFRAHSNTGALYHIDLYLVTGDLPDLPAGVYHFGPHDFALHRLRTGDYRGSLVEASGIHPRVAHAPLTVVSASTYWRNAWKYRARAYRHGFWDGGTLHANLLTVAGVQGLEPSVVLGFSDALVERLLGLDPFREGALTLVPLGRSREAPPSPPSVTELNLETEPLSGSEVDYPAIREMHAASSLGRGEEAAAWRAQAPEPNVPPAGGSVRPLADPVAVHAGTQASLSRIIRRRGSTRIFDPSRSISFEALSVVLDAANVGLPADFLGADHATLLDLYLIVHAVDGLAPGTYYFRRRERALELLTLGDFRREAGRLGLMQELPADAGVNIYSMCALPPILECFGNRGYRAAQLEGGITGGRMYLAAYAQGFGATGLTFFDDEVTEFFSPHAAGKSVMFLTALGHPDRARLYG